MRHRTILLPVFVILVAGCRTSPQPPRVPPENGGSAEAEEYLAAAGERAVPELRALLASTDDPDLAERMRSLLLYAGEDMDLSVEERVDLLLFDLSRSEPHPYLGLKALDRLLELGDAAIPPLEIAAARSDARGRTARRLLSRMREEQ